MSCDIRGCDDEGYIWWLERSRCDEEEVTTPFGNPDQGVDHELLPVLLTAPHGGSADLPILRCNQRGMSYHTQNRLLLERIDGKGVIKKGDLHTQEILCGIDEYVFTAMNKRCAVVGALFHRRFIDANRSPIEHAYNPSCPVAKRVYEGYHSAIERAANAASGSSGRHILHLDLHGMSNALYQNKIVIGTLNGKTLVDSNEVWSSSNRGFLWQLHNLVGSMVHPPNPPPLGVETEYMGGYTIQRHGGRSTLSNSIQLEFCREFRLDSTLRKKIVCVVGEAIVKHLEALGYERKTLNNSFSSFILTPSISSPSQSYASLSQLQLSTPQEEPWQHTDSQLPSPPIQSTSCQQPPQPPSNSLSTIHDPDISFVGSIIVEVYSAPKAKAHTCNFVGISKTSRDLIGLRVGEEVAVTYKGVRSKAIVAKSDARLAKEFHECRADSVHHCWMSRQLREYLQLQPLPDASEKRSHLPFFRTKYESVSVHRILQNSSS